MFSRSRNCSQQSDSNICVDIMPSHLTLPTMQTLKCKSMFKVRSCSSLGFGRKWGRGPHHVPVMRRHILSILRHCQPGWFNTLCHINPYYAISNFISQVCHILHLAAEWWFNHPQSTRKHSQCTYDSMILVYNLSILIIYINLPV